MIRPLWVDPEESDYPPLRSDREADVAIVGGGFAGLGAAYALRESGASVVLLEERTVASGASGRNAGFVLAGPALPYADVCAQLGVDRARAIWELTRENNRLLAALVEEDDIRCGFLRRGSMSLAASDEELTALTETLRCLQDAGISACAVDARDLPRPFDCMYRGGIYYSGNAEMNPGAFLHGIARHLSLRISIHERTPVIRLEGSGPWTLAAPGGTVRARSVVLATNAYTARLLPQLPIAPTRGQVLATEPISRVVVPFPMYANHGYQYWRQTQDGRLVIGGWRNLDVAGERGWEERLHPHIQSSLENFLRTVAGGDVPVTHRWAGIMGFTPDHMPLVGALSRRDALFIAAGFSGHGVSMAFTCGGLAARLGLGGPADVPAAFDPARFGTE